MLELRALMSNDFNRRRDPSLAVSAEVPVKIVVVDRYIHSASAPCGCFIRGGSRPARRQRAGLSLAPTVAYLGDA